MLYYANNGNVKKHAWIIPIFIYHIILYFSMNYKYIGTFLGFLKPEILLQFVFTAACCILELKFYNIFADPGI